MWGQFEEFAEFAEGVEGLDGAEGVEFDLAEGFDGGVWEVFGEEGELLGLGA